MIHVSFEDMSLVEILVRESRRNKSITKGLRGNLAAETIQPNIRRLIVIGKCKSCNAIKCQILQDLIQQTNDEAISYQEYLEELIKLAKMVIEPQGTINHHRFQPKHWQQFMIM